MNKNILILTGLFGTAFFGFYLYKKLSKPKPILDSSLNFDILPDQTIGPIVDPLMYV